MCGSGSLLFGTTPKTAGPLPSGDMCGIYVLHMMLYVMLYVCDQIGKRGLVSKNVVVRRAVHPWRRVLHECGCCVSLDILIRACSVVTLSFRNAAQKVSTS